MRPGVGWSAFHNIRQGSMGSTTKSVQKSHVKNYQSTDFFFLYLDFKQLHFPLWLSLPATEIALFSAPHLESIFQLKCDFFHGDSLYTLRYTKCSYA